VATASTDAQGRYLMRVPAGDYDVRATARGGYPATASKHVSVRADVTVNLVLDSGIRGPAGSH